MLWQLSLIMILLTSTPGWATRSTKGKYQPVGEEHRCHSIDIPKFDKAQFEFASGKDGEKEEATLHWHYEHFHTRVGEQLNGWIAKNYGVDYPDSEHSSVITHLIRELPRGSLPHSWVSLIFNHALFFELSKRKSDLEPTSALARAIASQFGGYNELKEQFIATANVSLGSGWIWLLHERTSDELSVSYTHDAQTPITEDDSVVPLLVCDLWEHAYIGVHKGEKAEFLNTWLDNADWDLVAARYDGGQVEYWGPGTYPNFRPHSI